MTKAVAASQNWTGLLQANSSDKVILGAIDIGTNSIHMVIVEIDPQLATFTIVAKEKDTVRLGERDRKTGKLTPEAISRALEALQRCQALAVSFNAQHIFAVATSAVREAPNGGEFLKQVDNELGLQVNLISGQEEARRIYLGVLSGMEFGQNPYIIIDIGGGSTELVLADRQEERFLSSTKVGAVRLMREFVSEDPISEAELVYLRAYVRGMLERPVENIRNGLAENEQAKMVGTSGTIQALAIVLARETEEGEPNPLTGYQVSLSALEELTERLAKMSYEERLQVSGLSEKRAEIIVPGAIVLVEAMKMLEMEAIALCERALREGIIVDWMLKQGLIGSPFRYQSEVRDRHVRKLAHKYQVDLEYSERTANFALSLFDQLQGKLHFWGESERDLLWAAAILHNSGIYISHAAHHKHSYYLIRNGELLGYTETELEIIANLARYHRKSTPKKKHENYQNLTDKRDRQIVNQLSALLRVAIALDRRQIGAVAKVECQYYGDRQRLELCLSPAFVGDDCELELWSLDYKKEVFEEEFGVKVVAFLDR
ncbi:Ppx/GppA phosphatase family protein [Spirulina sp. 06S082]|uniref:Ppx/GppA phosphatase family protein n=1 Tax=Spirulina sp. 06S082 TaxID=3110248 RepID=UPI002B20B870|nr:Ppx/GppA phosphatase family protein [Spirulina sp. 06S082]MEA5472457.1 Ppx/GppA phosphatase family protein [Spirulina sp. 06S082]